MPRFVSFRERIWRQYLDTKGSIQRKTKYLSVLNLAREPPTKIVFNVAVDFPDPSTGNRGFDTLILQS